jgi:DNA-binding CsgD family transcriptional regulator
LAICPGRRSAAVGYFVALTSECAPGACDTLVAVFVMRVQQSLNPNLSGIARCFGLTPAETRTLEHIVRGGGLPEAGAALRLAENTVKTHLKSIFIKTETSRQTELLALVHALRPPLSERACNERAGGA